MTKKLDTLKDAENTFTLRTDGKKYFGNITGIPQTVEDALLEYVIGNEMARIVIMRVAQRYMEYEMHENFEETVATTKSIQE